MVIEIREKNFVKVSCDATCRHAGADDTEPIRLPPPQHFHCNGQAEIKAAALHPPQ